MPVSPISVIVSNQTAAPLVVTVDAVALDTTTLSGTNMWPAAGSLYACNNASIYVTLHSVTLPPAAWTVGFSIEGSVDGENWAAMATESFTHVEGPGTKIVQVDRSVQYRVVCSSGATASATVTVVLSAIRS